jgi:hypothetical protein
MLGCRLVPMSGGATLVGFADPADAAETRRPLKVRRASLLAQQDETEDA